MKSRMSAYTAVAVLLAAVFISVGRAQDVRNNHHDRESDDVFSVSPPGTAFDDNGVLLVALRIQNKREATLKDVKVFEIEIREKLIAWRSKAATAVRKNADAMKNMPDWCMITAKTCTAIRMGTGMKDIIIIAGSNFTSL
jgi:hypothetical protein